MAFANFFDRNIHSLIQATPIKDTIILKETLSKNVIAVIFSDESMEFSNTPVIAETVINLLSRLYPKIAIIHDGTGDEGRKLKNDLLELAGKINPQIEFIGDEVQITASICIGKVIPRAYAIYPQGDGWNIMISKNKPLEKISNEIYNPFAAMGAACFGVGIIFNHIFQPHLREIRVPDNFVLSLLDYQWQHSEPIALPRVELNDVNIAGLGAVGNAAVFCLSKIENLSGTLTLIDHEKIDLSNLQRYMLTDQSSVGKMKTLIAESKLSKAGLKLIRINRKLHEYAAHDRCDCKFNIIAISIDNKKERIYAQALLPHIIINAWTADEKQDFGEFGISRHWFDSQQACLACSYLPKGNTKSDSKKIEEFTGIDERKIIHDWNIPLDSNILKEIAEKKGYPSEILEQWRGKPLHQLYNEAICGAALLEFQDGNNIQENIVPAAHQSALAGVFLAAEIAKVSLGITTRKSVAALKFSVFSIPYENNFENTPKTIFPQCICKDKYYLERYKEKYEIAE